VDFFPEITLLPPAESGHKNTAFFHFCKKNVCHIKREHSHKTFRGIDGNASIGITAESAAMGQGGVEVPLKQIAAILPLLARNLVQRGRIPAHIYQQGYSERGFIPKGSLELSLLPFRKIPV
jgi:hypothetical protein